MPKRVHVAVAVIKDPQGRVLVARRAEGAHQGGKLEFPGGKVEVGESVQAALQRELFEELGIHAGAMQPLININHQYSDKSVCLDVWQVLGFSGQAYGKEGQPIFWLPAEQLSPTDFPAANVPIITALQLPQQLMVSPDVQAEVGDVVAKISARIDQHKVTAVLLRLPRLSRDVYASVAELLLEQHPQVRWQIHSDVALAQRLGAGLHLPSAALSDMDMEQISAFPSLSASIHSVQQLSQAQGLGVDFALLGPVKATATHPHADTLGWAGFSSIAEMATIPVYALGGMQQADLPIAMSNGAQGIAGISLFAES